MKPKPKAKTKVKEHGNTVPGSQAAHFCQKRIWCGSLWDYPAGYIYGF